MLERYGAYPWLGQLKDLTRNHYSRLERLVRDDHSNSMCPFKSYQENHSDKTFFIHNLRMAWKARAFVSVKTISKDIGMVRLILTYLANVLASGHDDVRQVEALLQAVLLNLLSERLANFPELLGWASNRTDNIMHDYIGKVCLPIYHSTLTYREINMHSQDVPCTVSLV